MDSNFIKAGLKILAAIAAVVTGGTLAKKAHEDYKRGKELQESKRSKPVAG
ncbi:MAG: hypothetical protein J6W06_04840 [Bacteroidales bacterium]|jgi:uncharacterized membrane protein YebE (DUF533 family)|nr:hypothetical protein [Bacteroidales bacterium]